MKKLILLIVFVLFFLGANSGEEANINRHTRTRIANPIAVLKDQQTVDGFLPVRGIPKDNEEQATVSF